MSILRTALVAVILATPLTVVAQEIKFQTTKTLQAKSGEKIQVALLGRVTPQCQNAKVAIRLAIKPINGTIEARKVEMKKGVIAKCPDLVAQSAVFFYQSNPGFKGRDRVAIIVEFEGQKLGEQYDINVQ